MPGHDLCLAPCSRRVDPQQLRAGKVFPPFLGSGLSRGSCCVCLVLCLCPVGSLWPGEGWDDPGMVLVVRTGMMSLHGPSPAPWAVQAPDDPAAGEAFPLTKLLFQRPDSL